jgi:hypothetical protein
VPTNLEFHLVIDPEPAKGASGYIPVPAGAVQLAASPLGLVPLVEQDIDGIVLEPITRDHQNFLMLKSHGEERLRLNGQPAPIIAILAERDHLQLDDETGLHLTLFHRPRIEPPAPELIGKPCPVCLTPFTSDPPTLVYYCPRCNGATHCEGSDQPSEDRLECIQLSPTCPLCGEPVVMTQGYSWKPELNRD